MKEITADLSASMQLMAKRSFPNAILVADRFHVQQLVGEALSDLRIEHRWEALENENQAIKKAFPVAMQLTSIYNRKMNRGVALTLLSQWYNQI